MKPSTLLTTLLSLILLFLTTPTLTQGVQPCYNHADPDAGLRNYCQCDDGTCWERTNDENDCQPTSNVALNPCPVGHQPIGKKRSMRLVNF